jgi:hypothetical protein
LASNTWDWQISHPTFDPHSFLSSLKLLFPPLVGCFLSA